MSDPDAERRHHLPPYSWLTADELPASLWANEHDRLMMLGHPFGGLLIYCADEIGPLLDPPAPHSHDDGGRRGD